MFDAGQRHDGEIDAAFREIDFKVPAVHPGSGDFTAEGEEQRPRIVLVRPLPDQEPVGGESLEIDHRARFQRNRAGSAFDRIGQRRQHRTLDRNFIRIGVAQQDAGRAEPPDDFGALSPAAAGPEHGFAEPAGFECREFARRVAAGEAHTEVILIDVPHPEGLFRTDADGVDPVVVQPAEPPEVVAADPFAEAVGVGRGGAEHGRGLTFGLESETVRIDHSIVTGTRLQRSGVGDDAAGAEPLFGDFGRTVGSGLQQLRIFGRRGVEQVGGIARMVALRRGGIQGAAVQLERVQLVKLGMVDAEEKRGSAVCDVRFQRFEFRFRQRGIA